MKDGLTRKRQGSRNAAGPSQRFLLDFDVRLVVLSGPAAGSEHAIERERTTLGRGPGVDLAFADPTMSRQHAAVELAGTSLQVRDLGSTNGITVNDEPVHSAPLRHGDRIGIGGLTLQVLMERRSAVVDAYELPAEA